MSEFDVEQVVEDMLKAAAAQAGADDWSTCLSAAREQFLAQAELARDIKHAVAASVITAESGLMMIEAIDNNSEGLRKRIEQLCRKKMEKAINAAMAVLVKAAVGAIKIA